MNVSLARRRRTRPTQGGFTLIEMMVAVLVVAIVLGLSVPNLLREVRKDPLTQATNDFLEACRNAREIAIIRSVSMQVRISVEEDATHLVVEPAPRRDASRWIGAETPATPEPAASEEGERKPRPSQTTPFSGVFDDSVAFTSLRVNLREITGNESAVALRFHPNGTCDQFEGVIHHNQLGDRKVTLEVTTGWAEVEKVH